MGIINNFPTEDDPGYDFNKKVRWKLHGLWPRVKISNIHTKLKMKTKIEAELVGSLLQSVHRLKSFDESLLHKSRILSLLLNQNNRLQRTPKNKRETIVLLLSEIFDIYVTAS